MNGRAWKFILVSSVLACNWAHADFPRTSVEWKAQEEGEAPTSRYDVYIDTLRFESDDGNADSQIQLAQELLMSTKLKSDDLPKIKLLIDAAESKLGAEKVSMARSLLKGQEGKVAGTTIISEPIVVGLSPKRPHSPEKAEFYARCSAMASVLNEEIEKAKGATDQLFTDFSVNSAVASILYSDSAYFLKIYQSNEYSYKYQMARHRAQTIYALQNTMNACMASMKKDIAEMKPFEKSARDDFFKMADNSVGFK